MEIIRANKQHLHRLAPLFDGYRVFYKQTSDPTAAEKFLTERFDREDSVVFLALDNDGKGMGFTQLYPSFSSVSMQRVYILNDLYVASAWRGQGVGAALLNAAKAFALKAGSKGLTLETDVDNPAQHLYERLGWKKDDDVFHYTWTA